MAAVGLSCELRDVTISAGTAATDSVDTGQTRSGKSLNVWNLVPPPDVEEFPEAVSVEMVQLQAWHWYTVFHIPKATQFTFSINWDVRVR